MTFKKIAAVKEAIFFGDEIVAPITDALGRMATGTARPKQRVFDAVRSNIADRVKMLRGAPDHFQPLNREIVIGNPNATILAHEAGHADISKTIPGNYIQNIPSTIAFHKAPVIAGLGGLGSGIWDAATNEDHTGRDAVIGGLLTGPTLASEAGASLLGLQKLHAAGASRGELLNAAKSLGAAFGTYGTVPVAAGLNYGVGRLIGNTIGEEYRKSKRPSKPTKQQKIKTAAESTTDDVPYVTKEDLYKILGGTAGGLAGTATGALAGGILGTLPGVLLRSPDTALAGATVGGLLGSVPGAVLGVPQGISMAQGQEEPAMPSKTAMAGRRAVLIKLGMTPYLKAGLGAGLVGAGAGALGGYLGSENPKTTDDDVLRGALLGAGLGAGTGIASRGISELLVNQAIKDKLLTRAGTQKFLGDPNVQWTTGAYPSTLIGLGSGYYKPEDLKEMMNKDV